MKIYYKKQWVELTHMLQLYQYLETNHLELKKVIEHPAYAQFQIPKKHGGKRNISAPGKKLKEVQSKLNELFSDFYISIKPDCVHGFIRKKEASARWNTKSNASVHIGKNYVLNIDLKEFFHSITTDMVKSLFMKSPFDCNENLATVLALICCYQRKLPMGAPTSPVISNLFCYEMDLQLMEYCTNKNITYTRYADDLTFSSNEEITDDIFSDIQDFISKHQLTINQSKVRMQTKFGKQWVTGLKVNEKVNVDRTYKRNIRAMKHDIRKNGIEAAAKRHFRLKEDDAIQLTMIKKFESKLAGRMGWIKYISAP